MAADRDEHLTMIEDCEARESKLSDWERGFIDSIKKQMEQPGFQLSPKQEERLEEIWNKVT
jgi:hypothetical protein